MANRQHDMASPATGFYGLGIAPAILEALNKLGLTEPTPIQRQTIPIAIEGKDVLGIAQTGTGKTYAFGIPMIQRLAQIKKQGLIILPTRDLADQVNAALQGLGKRFQLRTSVLIGGASLEAQIRSLARRPHIIIATPGRLNDHLSQRPKLLTDVGIVVLDEADRMLDMGFAPQIKKIFQVVPHERQTMLFSATMPSEITALARSYMQIPIRVEIAPTGTISELVTQELFIVEKNQKLDLLVSLLERFRGPALVFTKTKYAARAVTSAIRELGVRAAEIHSNRSLSQRRAALDGFKKGTYRVLVATDIASRGIDVAGIELVVNFDLPTTSDDYVHRIGRTARAGAVGHAISFALPSEKNDIRAIERLTRTPLPLSKLPQLPKRISMELSSRRSITPYSEKFKRTNAHPWQSGRGDSRQRHGRKQTATGFSANGRSPRRPPQRGGGRGPRAGRGARRQRVFRHSF